MEFFKLLPENNIRNRNIYNFLWDVWASLWHWIRYFRYSSYLLYLSSF